VVLLRLPLTLLLFAAASILLVSEAYHRSIRTPDAWVVAVEASGAFEKTTQQWAPDVVNTRLVQTWPRVNKPVLREADDLVKRVISTDWLRIKTREVAAAGLRYAVGQSDELSLTIALADRVDAGAAVLGERAALSPLATAAWERLTEMAARGASRRELPFGIQAQPDVWLKAIQVAAPRDWVGAAFGREIDQAADWLTGRTNRLSVTIPLHERRHGVAEAMALLVRHSNVLPYLREHIVRPALVDRLPNTMLVPQAGIRLTAAETADALVGIADSDWAAVCRDSIVQATAQYLTGEADRLELSVPLDPLIDQVAARITGLILSKVRAWLEQQPRCEGSRAVAWLKGKINPLSCRPSRLEKAAAIAVLSAHVRSLVKKAIAERAEDPWVHGEEDVKRLVDDHTWALIQRARRWGQTGIQIREETIRDALARDAPGILDRVLTLVRAGVQLDGAPLQLELETRLGPDRLRRARRGLDLMDRYRYAPLVGLLALMLLSLVIPGGARTRLWWTALGPFAAGAVIAAAAMYGEISLPAEAVTPTLDQAALQRVALLAVPAAEAMIGVFMESLAGLAAVMTACAVGLFGVGGLLGRSE
jgi:hypothetical protein